MKLPPFRFWIAVMIFWATFTNYMLRANISVSIIKMVDKKEGKKHVPACLKDSQEESKTNTSSTKNTTKTRDENKFDWDENQTGDILAGYFYGYLIAMIPAGVATDMLGAWNMIFWTNLASTALTILTPLSTKGGHIGVTINRAFIGFLGGFVYPACNAIIASWAPPKEKGKFMSAMLGNTIGTLVTFNLVGVVTEAWGWPWGFYVTATLMGVFLVFFFFLVSDNPSKSRWTSPEEQEFILSAQEGHLAKKKGVPPFLKLITSIPLWMACLTQLGSLWDLNLVMTYAPKFMSETLGFNLKASAGLAALPYLSRMSCGILFGSVGDRMRKRNVFGSVTRIRKFFVIFSHLLPAGCLFLTIAAGCNAYALVSLLIINMGFNGATVVSILINPQDLTPNFAATCFGFMNFIGMLSGVLVPKITGAVNEAYNMELIASTIIFVIGGCVQLVTGALFILFGSAEVQPWNEIKPKDPKEGTSEQKT